MNAQRLSVASILIAVTLSGAIAASSPSNKKGKKPQEPSALDKYIQEALSHGTPAVDQPSSGSLWQPGITADGSGIGPARGAGERSGDGAGG